MNHWLSWRTGDNYSTFGFKVLFFSKSLSTFSFPQRWFWLSLCVTFIQTEIEITKEFYNKKRKGEWLDVCLMAKQIIYLPVVEVTGQDLRCWFLRIVWTITKAILKNLSQVVHFSFYFCSILMKSLPDLLNNEK